MTLYEDLKYRNLIKDFSNEQQIKQMLQTPQTIYCGFDPSAESMHMGNFVMVMTLMRLQKAGHKIVALVGGGTGMIGDPSGRSSERQLLDADQIKNNTEKIHAQLSKYIDLDDERRGMIINNYDWLSKISMLDYLRDYGKYFSVNYMLAKDTVKSRLEEGISYTEFSYMILQSIDFLHLYMHHGVTMQIGGSDQWGNLVSGLDLMRRVLGSEITAEVMTAHLLTNDQGEKFGKSIDGAMFIDKKKFSSYKLYQYFINVSDEEALNYLKVLTFLEKDEIELIAKEHGDAPHKRLAQTRLAHEIVTIVHGYDDAIKAEAMSAALFNGDFQSLMLSDLDELFATMKVKVVLPLKLEDFLIKVKGATSKREAREFISGNAVSVNGVKVTDPSYEVRRADLLHNKYVVLKRGRRNYYVGEQV